MRGRNSQHTLLIGAKSTTATPHEFSAMKRKLCEAISYSVKYRQFVFSRNNILDVFDYNIWCEAIFLQRYISKIVAARKHELEVFDVKQL